MVTFWNVVSISVEKLEDVRVERRPHQYLYMEGADYIFMNQETFDQIPIAHDLD